MTIDENSRLHAMLTQYVPIYAWLALLGTLQGAFWSIAEGYEGVKTYSEIQLRTMRRYWTYTLCTMYITVLSGSVLDSVGQSWQRPRQIILFLGQAVPRVSSFFLSVVLSKALLTMPLLALRPGALLRAPWATSEEEYFVAVDYGSKLPDLLLVFTVCVAYAPLAPLLILAGAVFFAVALFTFRFGALYTWQQRFQSQGSFFHFFLRQVVSVLPVAVLTLIAALMLLRGYAQAVLLLPLLGFTLVFRNWLLGQLEAHVRLPLQLAQELDALEAELQSADRKRFQAPLPRLSGG
eukprot:CAMPEP_0117604768 /NCGR_PEP_ID=MMETSP0784-20121206/78854_1 /TAXON_ID=39447 /ORGANISM="" /LENGTH=292 /DNA_ID=CAMNT_0005407803 /DNA_START=137 /DNA_END=1011 /DNA_ORIENTATION=+